MCLFASIIPTSTKSAYRVPTSQRIAQKRANEYPWECDGGKEQLPLCGFLDVAIMNDARNNGRREHSIWEGHKVV